MQASYIVISVAQTDFVSLFFWSYQDCRFMYAILNYFYFGDFVEVCWCMF